jgi:soluble lytic murein transglycosylase-like protein
MGDTMRASAQRQRAAARNMEDSIARQRESVARQRQSVAVSRAAPASEAAGAEFDCTPLTRSQIDPLLQEAAARQGLRPDLLRAVIKHESAFYPCAVSSKGALGLMQLMPINAERFGLGDPFEPRQNVNAGAKLLKELLERYGNLALALGAYNAGPGRVDAAGDVPPIEETQRYVENILKELPGHSGARIRP